MAQLSSWYQVPAHQTQLGRSVSGEQNTSCYNTIKERYPEITFHQLTLNWLQVTENRKSCSTAHGNSL